MTRMLRCLWTSSASTWIWTWWLPAAPSRSSSRWRWDAHVQLLWSLPIPHVQFFNRWFQHVRLRSKIRLRNLFSELRNSLVDSKLGPVGSSIFLDYLIILICFSQLAGNFSGLSKYLNMFQPACWQFFWTNIFSGLSSQLAGNFLNLTSPWVHWWAS